MCYSNHFFDERQLGEISPSWVIIRTEEYRESKARCLMRSPVRCLCMYAFCYLLHRYTAPGPLHQFDAPPPYHTLYCTFNDETCLKEVKVNCERGPYSVVFAAGFTLQPLTLKWTFRLDLPRCDDWTRYGSLPFYGSIQKQSSLRCGPEWVY